ncbi:MAG: hypothetical protein R2932_55320 [Caldilineaceae bacterium]
MQTHVYKECEKFTYFLPHITLEIEVKRKDEVIEPETAVKPVETKAEIALVAPTLVIKQMTPAALDKPNAKGDKPSKLIQTASTRRAMRSASSR